MRTWYCVLLWSPSTLHVTWRTPRPPFDAARRADVLPKLQLSITFRELAPDLGPWPKPFRNFLKENFEA